jgi:hypothetical protein
MKRRRGGARLMWLSSFRLTEVVVSNQALNEARHELRVHDLCEEIVLDPFSETEVAAYLAKRSPSISGDEGFVRAPCTSAPTARHSHLLLPPIAPPSRPLTCPVFSSVLSPVPFLGAPRNAPRQGVNARAQPRISLATSVGCSSMSQ